MLGTITGMTDRQHEIKAAYRLLDCPQVTAPAVLQAHLDRVRQECDLARLCLLIEDTTSVAPASFPSAQGLGPLGDEELHTRGFWLHSTLAVDLSWRTEDSDQPELRMIGLFNQQAWARAPLAQEPLRDKRQTTKMQRRARENRESLRWGACLPEHPARDPNQRIFVADRESDIYEAFERCQKGHTRFVIRLCQDRAIMTQESDPEAPRRLRAAVESAPAGQRLTIDLPGGHGKKPRMAQVEIRAASVDIRAPQRPGHSAGWSSYPLNVVAIQEINAPAGTEPVEWLLLTDLPADSALSCRRVVAIYRCRWLIEEFHKGLKTGAGLEQSQLREVRKLMAWGAVLSVVTTWLLGLKMATREAQEPRETELSPEVDDTTLLTLERLGHGPRAGERWTRRRVIRAIAGLGGFMGRKSDGEPGWQTIWRGWSRLNLILLGVSLGKKENSPHKCGE